MQLYKNDKAVRLSWFSFGMRVMFITLGSLSRVRLKSVMFLSKVISTLPNSSMFEILPLIAEFSNQNR